MTADPGSPILKRAALSALRATVTLAVIGAAGGAVFLGRDALATRADAVPMPEPAPRIAVETEVIRLVDSYEVMRRFAGQFEAARETDLGFESGGTVSEMRVTDGQRVKAGDVLARLDTRLVAAERRRLEAARAAVGAEAELARRRNERQ